MAIFRTKAGKPINLGSGILSFQRYFPLSDFFNGVGHNSSVVGDDNWNRRWTAQGTVSNVLIENDKLVLRSNGGNTNKGRIEANMDDTPIGTFQINNITIPNDGSNDIYFTWELEIGVTEYRISAGRVAGGQNIALDGVPTAFNGTNCSLRVRHNGTIWVAEYDEGSGWTHLGNLIDGELTPINETIFIHLANQSGSTKEMTIDSITVLDGNGNPKYIPRT